MFDCEQRQCLSRAESHQISCGWILSMKHAVSNRVHDSLGGICRDKLLNMTEKESGRVCIYIKDSRHNTNCARVVAVECLSMANTFISMT